MVSKGERHGDHGSPVLYFIYGTSVEVFVHEQIKQPHASSCWIACVNEKGNRLRVYSECSVRNTGYCTLKVF